MNVIDSFLIALGFKVDAAGIDEAKRKAQEARDSIISMGTALTGLVAGLAIHKVAEIGSTFEQNRIQIAGFFTALGQSSDFNQGLVDASDVMKKITADAAKLPGEAEDFVEVFKRSFSFVQGAMPGANKEQIADFTNKLTAIGIGWHLDAGIIAREFDHMLSPGKGTASLRLPFFAQLLPYMQKVKNDAHFTAEAFNEMTAPERLKLMQETLGTLDPMLAAMGKTFEAMVGAIKSSITTMVRLGGAGLFENIKDAMGALSATFVDDKGELTHAGKDVVAMLASIGSVIGTLLIDAGQFVAMLAKLTHHSMLFKAALLALSAVIAGAAFDKGLTSLLKFVKGFQRATLVTGLFAIAIFLVTEDIWSFFHGAQSVTGILVDKLGPGILAVAAAVGGLTAALLALKIQAVAAAAGMSLAFAPLFVWILALGLVAIAIYMVMANWDALVQKLEDGANAIIDKLNSIIDKINEVVQAFGFRGFGHIEHQLLLAKDPQALDNFRTPEHFRRLGEAEDENAIPAWLAPTKTGGHATSSTPVVHHGDMNVDIKIDGAKDPRETGREVQRAIRTSQTRIKR